MIEVENLSKQFGTKTAVDHLSFSVRKGEVLGFLGPNGAGKSTTMRMVTGFLPPSSGEAKVCGFSIVDQPNEAKQKIGYLPESAPLYNDMTVTGFLRFCADVRGLSGNTKKDAVERAIETCFLQSVAFQSIDTLSKGYRHRTCLAQALLHDPEVLILDEPTDGLDPNQKHEVRGLIAELARERTLLLSTHILEEVEAVCTRAIIIARGRVLADDTPAGLLSRSRYHNAVSLRPGDSIAARAALDGMPGVSGFEQDERQSRLYVFPQGRTLSTEAVAERLRQRGVPFSDLRQEPGRLDEVFRQITAQAAA